MLRRLWFLVTRTRRRRELDEEMRLHVALREAANRRREPSRIDNARAARVRFGNPIKLREDAMDVWRVRILEDAARNLRYALRRFHQQPGGALVVTLTLALGIGATTAMFSLVDALFLKPAPWDATGRLAWIVSLDRGTPGPRNVAYADYVAYRERTTRFAGLAAESGAAMAVGTRQPRRVLGSFVSGNYFEVLGIRPEVGRVLTGDDDGARGAEPVVVLSHALWVDQFGGSPTAVGAPLTINGQPFTIVGVAPRGFTGAVFAADPNQLWIPTGVHALVTPQRDDSPTTASEQALPPVRVVGRLAPGVSVAAADAEVRVIAASLEATRAEPDPRRQAGVLPLRGGLTPWEQAAMASMFGLMAIVPTLVLLVACANVANVLLAQHHARHRELAMRRAIGASRGRVIQQLLTESFIVALGAAVIGTGTAWLLTRAIVVLGNVPVDVSVLVDVNTRALFAAVTAAMGAILLFGLLPALTATRFNVLPVLKDEGTTTTSSRGSSRLRRAMLVTQVALSLTLLVTAGLFLQSLSRTLRVDPGFDPHGLAIASFDTGLLGYSAERRADFATQFLEQASALVGVTSAAAANIMPLGGTRYGATLHSESGASVSTSLAQVSPAYFDTLALPIVRGRTFTTAEAATGAAVAIVSASAAQRLWPGADPIGQTVRTDDRSQPPAQVVGVAGDSKSLFLDEAPSGVLYVPLSPASSATFAVRSSGDLAQTLASLRDIARTLDPNLPVDRAETMDQRIHRSANLRRAMVAFLGVLGSVTLLLAAVGIYGVAAHHVSVRTREVGIRMALGARPTDVLRLVVGQQLRLSFAGIVIGVVLSASGATLLSSFLFGLSQRDVTVFVGGALILCSVAAVASYIPARQAVRLDPLRALRHG